jgi:hypothetical protein
MQTLQIAKFSIRGVHFSFCYVRCVIVGRDGQRRSHTHFEPTGCRRKFSKKMKNKPLGWKAINKSKF